MTAITYSTPGLQDPDLIAMIEESIAHPYLGEIVRSRLTSDTILFRYEGHPAGYAVPRLEGGYWRVGPIYVREAYRGKGIAKDFIQRFYRGRRGRAYIEPGNTASARTFIACGFIKTGRVMLNKDGKAFEQYQLDHVPKVLYW